MVALYRLQANMLEHAQQHQFIARPSHKSSSQHDRSNLISGWIMAGSNLMQHEWRRDADVSIQISCSAYVVVWDYVAGEGRYCDGWCLLP